ncbi:hypothetical protein [Paremcibacter congregatus]|nr:hypothetical protein [Paremcibacter congregatus]
MSQEIHNGPVPFNFDLTIGGLTGDELFDAIIDSKLRKNPIVSVS